MPWKVVKRKCKQADGTVGSYVVVKEKSKGSTEQESCHTSKEKAEAAVRARYANKNEGRGYMKITKKQLRQLIESFISGPRGTMAVPDTDPSLEIADLSDEHLQKMRKLHGSSQSQYDALAGAFGQVEDSDAEMYDYSPSDAYAVYKDPQGEYDERSKPENLFNSLIANYKAQAPDMLVVSQPDAVSGQGIIKNFIYSKDKSVLRKLLQNFEDKPETFEVNKDPADSSRGFIDNIYVKLANHPRFANNPAIQQFLGKYVMIVRYDKFK